MLVISRSRRQSRWLEVDDDKKCKNELTSHRETFRFRVYRRAADLPERETKTRLSWLTSHPQPILNFSTATRRISATNGLAARDDANVSCLRLMALFIVCAIDVIDWFDFYKFQVSVGQNIKRHRSQSLSAEEWIWDRPTIIVEREREEKKVLRFGFTLNPRRTSKRFHLNEAKSQTIARADSTWCGYKFNSRLIFRSSPLYEPERANSIIFPLSSSKTLSHLGTAFCSPRRSMPTAKHQWLKPNFPRKLKSSQSQWSRWVRDERCRRSTKVKARIRTSVNPLLAGSSFRWSILSLITNWNSLSEEIPADSELGQKFLDFRLSLVKKSFLGKGTKKEIFLLVGSIKLCGAQQTIKFIEFLNLFMNLAHPEEKRVQSSAFCDVKSSTNLGESSVVSPTVHASSGGGRFLLTLESNIHNVKISKTMMLFHS